MKIINLVEDTQGRRGCPAEHGLSFYIETEKHKLLMDTGATSLLLNNAKRLGIDLTQVDTVVISHGHNDHAGGLLSFAQINPHAAIYIRRGAEEGHYAQETDGSNLHSIGMDEAVRALPQVVWTEGNLIIDDELSLFTGITGRRLWPQGNARLKEKQGEELRQDEFRHEQCLVIRQNGQRILLSGCAHNGILNILERFRELCGGEPDVVISGFHMMKTGRYTEEELRTILATARELKKTKTIYYTGHCTGERAYRIMKKIMGGQLRPVHCGDEIRIPKTKKRRDTYMKCHKFFAWATVVCFIMTMITGYRKK